MNWNSFDRVIARFNQIVLACLFCLGGLAFAGSIALGFASFQQQQPKTEVERQEKDYDATLSNFEQVSGTQLMVARLASEADLNSKYDGGLLASPGFASYSTSFSNANYAAQNYLFLDAHSGTSHWLVPANDSLFFAEHQLHEDANVEHGKLKTVSYIFIKMPRTKHSRHAEADDTPKALVFYKLSDGTTKTLATNVKQLFAVQEVLKQQALIMFKDENKNYAMAIDTETGDQIYKKELSPLVGEATPQKEKPSL